MGEEGGRAEEPNIFHGDGKYIAEFQRFNIILFQDILKKKVKYQK